MDWGARKSLWINSLLLFETDQIIDLGFNPVVCARRLAALFKR
jgi:hypothetical protein